MYVPVLLARCACSPIILEKCLYCSKYSMLFELTSLDQELDVSSSHSDGVPKKHDVPVSKGDWCIIYCAYSKCLCQICMWRVCFH